MIIEDKTQKSPSVDEGLTTIITEIFELIVYANTTFLLKSIAS